MESRSLSERISDSFNTNKHTIEFDGTSTIIGFDPPIRIEDGEEESFQENCKQIFKTAGLDNFDVECMSSNNQLQVIMISPDTNSNYSLIDKAKAFAHILKSLAVDSNIIEKAGEDFADSYSNILLGSTDVVKSFKEGEQLLTAQSIFTALVKQKEEKTHKRTKDEEDEYQTDSDDSISNKPFANFFGKKKHKSSESSIKVGNKRDENNNNRDSETDEENQDENKSDDDSKKEVNKRRG